MHSLTGTYPITSTAMLPVTSTSCLELKAAMSFRFPARWGQMRCSMRTVSPGMTSLKRATQNIISFNAQLPQRCKRIRAVNNICSLISSDQTSRHDPTSWPRVPNMVPYARKHCAAGGASWKPTYPTRPKPSAKRGNVVGIAAGRGACVHERRGPAMPMPMALTVRQRCQPPRAVLPHPSVFYSILYRYARTELRTRPGPSDRSEQSVSTSWSGFWNSNTTAQDSPTAGWSWT